MPTPTPIPVRRGASPAVVALVVMEGVLGLSAVYGTYGLLTGTLGMPDAWLAGSPFVTWTFPAVALLLVVAVPMLTAAVLELRRHRLAPTVTVLAGTGQVGWIAAQLLVFQRYFVLQPVVLLVAAVILLVAGLRRAGHGG